MCRNPRKPLTIRSLHKNTSPPLFLNLKYTHRESSKNNIRVILPIWWKEKLIVAFWPTPECSGVVGLQRNLDSKIINNLLLRSVIIVTLYYLSIHIEGFEVIIISELFTRVYISESEQPDSVHAVHIPVIPHSNSLIF